jgi:DNA (cytosine-5)-methyltransferase 1
MRFIDLFAGLGGFHLALKNLGHECVFASEIDYQLRQLYHKNFGIFPQGDIKDIHVSDVPKHEILTGGFPCQTFSKAGGQLGLDDFDRGTLFDDIARILKYRQPKFFILENVANLEKHDKGKTWKIIYETLTSKLGYEVSAKKLSPHMFGVPQIRERIFIVGSRVGLKKFNWPQPTQENTDINTVLDVNPIEAKLLPDREMECLEIWQEFLNRLPTSAKLPSFPIWSMEFGADYPFQETVPYELSQSFLDPFLGAFGQSLHGMNKKDQLERISKYSRTKQENGLFPRWKIRFIKQNREFYAAYKKYIDPILPRLQNLPPSWQKFEWNCQGSERVILNHIIQFRGSGIRVKRTNYSPSLVASTSTQIPIVGWERRYITIKEASRLQSLEDINIKLAEGSAYKALGNAVNAKIVELIARNLIQNNDQENSAQARENIGRVAGKRGEGLFYSYP